MIDDNKKGDSDEHDDNDIDGDFHSLQHQENNKSRLASERSDQQVFGKSQFFVPVHPASHQSLTRQSVQQEYVSCDLYSLMFRPGYQHLVNLACVTKV